jgi:hypothetical protein
MEPENEDTIVVPIPMQISYLMKLRDVYESECDFLFEQEKTYLKCGRSGDSIQCRYKFEGLREKMRDITNQLKPLFAQAVQEATEHGRSGN